MLRSRRRMLIKLSLSTGLIGTLALIPSLAHAQSTPALPTVKQGAGITFTVQDPPAVAATYVGVLDTQVATVDGSATKLTVDLGVNPASIIEWQSFNIANGSQARFNSALVKSAVLNRVTGPLASDLAGTLDSGSGVSVFLVNTNGIMLRPTGVVSTSSFVASSLELTDTDFNTGLTSGKFHFASAGTAEIGTEAGSTINLGGGDHGLLLVAPRIVSNGNLDAGSGETAFVLASDTNVTFTSGSPLGIEIVAGTPLAGATVGGTVAGRNVYFAAASQASVLDFLLGVDGNITASAGAERGIVISAGSVLPGNGVTYGAGDVGGSARINASGSLTSGADVLASANDDVTLFVADGPGNLIVSAGDQAALATAFGATDPFATVDVSGAGITLSGNVTSTGAQTYHAPVTLGADVTLASTAGGAVAFDGTVDGNQNLAINTTGATSFAGAVGGATRLASLTTNAGGTTAINGDRVQTTGLQSFGDAVTVGGPTTQFDSNGSGAISFGSTLDGASAVTIATGGATTFSGAVGGTTRLTSLTTDAGGTTAVNGGLVQTTGLQSLADTVTVAGPTTLFDSNAGGAITFGSTLNGASDVTVTTSGLTTFGGAVGNLARLTSLTTNGGGATAVNGDRAWTSGLQNFADAVTVGGPTTNFGSNGGGAITFGSTLDGGSDVSVTTSGLTTFGGDIGGTTRLTSLTADFGGATAVNGGVVQTTGLQNFADAVTVAGPTTLFDSNGGGAISFASTLDGGSAVTVTTSGLTTFAGQVGGTTRLTSLTTDGGGTTAVDGALVQTTGLQNFADAVTVAGPTTLFDSNGGGAITFGSTLDGASDVTVTTSGTTTFSGRVGDTARLTSLITDGGGTTAVNGDFVQTTGLQNYADAVTVDGPTTLFDSNGGGAITFASTLDGASNVTVTTSGLTTFGGRVGGTTRLTSLTTDGSGTTAIDGDRVRTTGLQNFADALTLAGPTSLFDSNGGGAITFGSTLDGASDVTVTTGGLTTFAGQVGGTVRLSSLTVNGGGATAVNGGLVQTTGLQDYVDAATVGGASTLFDSNGGGAISFASTLDGASNVTVTTSALTTFGGVAGGNTRLASLTIGGTGAAAVNGGGVLTTGAQSFGITTVGGSTTLFDSNGGGAIGFATLDGGSNVTLTTSGSKTVAGDIGATTRLASLVSDGGGTTTVNGALVRSTGLQNYTDALIVAGPTTLFSSSGGGTITFGSTLDGASDVTVTTSGLTTFGGAVGGATRLTSLTTDGGGTTAVNGGRVWTTGLQNFADAVTLAGPTTQFDSNGGGAITFASTLDGASAVTVTTSGVTTFGGHVGESVPLTSLLVNGAGSTSINSVKITTSGGQTFDEPVNLFSNGGTGSTLTTLASTGGGDIVLNGDVAAGGALKPESLLIQTTGNATLGGNLDVNGFGVQANTLAGPLSATINTLAADLNGPLNFTNGQGLTVGTVGSLSGVDVGSNFLTLTAMGPLTLAADVTGGAVTFNANSLTQNAGTRLTASSLAGSIAGPASLTSILNGIDTLAAFTSEGLTLSDATQLIVNGPVDAGAGALSLYVKTGDLLLQGNLHAGASTKLTADAGQIAQTAGIIDTPSLTAAAATGISLPSANLIGAFTALNSPAGGVIARSAQPGGVSVLQVAGAGDVMLTGDNSLALTGATISSGAGDVTLGGPVTLTGSSSVTATGVGGTVTFNGTVDGPGALGVASNAGTLFNGEVGAGVPLASLGVTGPATFAGSVVTDGSQSYGNVMLTGAANPRSFVSNNDQSITFHGMLDGAYDVTVTTGGLTSFGGQVGGATRLTSLTTNGGGTTDVIGSGVQTTGLQNFADNVRLAGPTTVFDSNGGGTITFGGALDGASAVTVNTSRVTTFGGAVGGTTRLRSLATDGVGSTAVNGGLVRTTGLQNFADGVNVTGPTTLFDSNVGPITFGSTLDGASAVTVATSGLTTFGAGVGGTTRLMSLTTNGGGVTAINGAVVRTTGQQTFVDAVTVGGPTTMFDSNGGGAISFASTLNGASGVSVTTSGLTSFDGAVSLASLAADGGGTTAVNGGGVQTTGTQTFMDATTLGGSASLFESTGGGAITFASTLDGGSNVTVTTSGDKTFGADVGATTRVASLISNGGGTTTVNGALVRSAGLQNYTDALIVTGPTTLFSSTGGGAIMFGSTLDGGSDVTVTTGGLTTFGAGVGSTTRLTSLTTDGGGITAVNGDRVQTTGLQNFADAVTLAGPSTLFDSNGDAISFASTLNGISNATVTTSGLTTFGGAVGGSSALSSLTTNGGGMTAINGGHVVTASTGTQTFLDQVTLGANTEFRGLSGSFAAGLLGNSHNVTFDYVGTSLIDGGFTGIDNLVTGAGGTTQLSGTISTMGAQTYGDAVSLVGATTLVSTGDRSISFMSTLDGGQNLTVDTGGTVSLVGLAGGTTRLGNLGIDAGGIYIVDARVASAGLTASGTATIGNLDATGPASVTAGSAGIGSISGSSVSVSAGTVSVDSATAGSALTLHATAGPLSLATGHAGTTADLTATDAVRVTNILTSGGAATLTGATVNANSVTAGSALTATATGGALTLGTGDAGTTADLKATGDLKVTNSLTSGGAATLTGATVDVNSVTAGSTLTATAAGGGLRLGTGHANTTAVLDATAELNVTNSLTTGQAATLTGATIDANSVTAGSALTATAAGGGLTLGTGQAGTTADLKATANLAVTNSLTSGGAATLSAGTAATAGSVDVTKVTAGSALKMTATGGTLTLGTGSVGTTADLNSSGDLKVTNSLTSGGAATLVTGAKADLGNVTAGPSLTITARDMELRGAISGDTVRLVNGNPASTVMRLGTGTQDGGLRLTTEEINRIVADSLTFDGRTGAIEIGTLPFDADAGSDTVNAFTTGNISILGAVSGSGAGRLFNFGGDGAGGQAATIFAQSTPDGGGRLLFNDADLQLNGNRIAIGEGILLDSVRDLNADTVASQFVSNPNSSLYNSFVGGGVQYKAEAGPLVSAGSFTVNYDNFALVQNTGLPGTNSGVVLGALNSPSEPALTLNSSSDANGNAFALFGSVNGITDAPAAVLGSQVLVINHVVVANSRVNGCIIGSGAGCLTTTTTQPTLNFFDSSVLDVLTSSVDFSLPFDPLIGSNNEAFYSGFGSADLPVVPQPKCDAADKSGRCPDGKE